MEIGNITNTITTPTVIKAPEEVGTNTKTKQESAGGQENNKDFMQKMKEDPGYVPTLQEKAVIKAIEAANQKIVGGPREFQFSIHEKTKQIMVNVVDTNTKEVIRQVPSEKVLDMVAGLMEAAGLLVDEKR